MITRSRSSSTRGPQLENLEIIKSNFRSLKSTESRVSNKPAAVLVALFEGPDGKPHVWLTQRSKDLPTHPGEVCLPGGKRDLLDPSDEFTAKREAHEEIGLDPAMVTVLGQLPPLLSECLLSVTPVVATIPATFTPSPNPGEVAMVFSAPLNLFLEPPAGTHSTHLITWQDKPYRLHSFQYKGFQIWGLTATILIEVAKRGYGRPTTFEE
ncbi:hypothetical protein CEUSTIGMA_g4328.t1 [Chlamydomonas eustigma]|uniref:Nudix hydrolase domain-containing protein n=1 Tax=Chlamydomonas eustigma TaxID=1157962 RepID=A0A250X1W6_9CHLO|nr:hypothetical protein CEUSTIGMA_g4328.t1 [Chlamydomonas eustigma]|eukprot:GAX76882.1 hypothetical protein CEUSTIGMA_g4328.t1 [Chlamydomonas eustigma]